MFRAACWCLVVLLAVPSHEQSTPPSPCPNVFQYEPTGSEPGRWYGVVNLSTDSILHSLWLNVVLDSKADILGNWVGDVSTTDNIDFKIENTKMKIQPGPATAVRFFVQYNPLNKAPKLQAIRLNGREICNANLPTAVVDRPDSDYNVRPDTTTSRSISRPDGTKPRPTEIRPIEKRPSENKPVDTRPIFRPEDGQETKPVKGTPSIGGPVYVPTPSPDQGSANPYSIGGGQYPSQNIAVPSNGGGSPRPDSTHVLTTTAPNRRHTNRPVTDDNDYGDSKPDPDDYFSGPRPVIPVKPDRNNNNNNNNYRGQSECGKVVRNSPNPLVVNGKPTLEGQWPWQIALYQTRVVDNKYICGGTLVSNRHVVTAAHCVTLKSSSRVVNKNTLTVYLGKHNLRTSIEGVQIRFVGDITVHPQYNASSFSKDLSVLELLETVQFTDWVRPACLWPEELTDLSNVIGKTGSVVGWGFDETGVATEELSLVEMPVVDQETCIRSYSEFFTRFTSEYTYCAGFRDGTSVCNGDSGGGMVFKMQNTWYLRGLVSLSVAKQADRCDPSHYVVFTDLAKFVPWIKQVISS